MPLTQRQQDLLVAIINNYVKSGEPIASGDLDIGSSSATVRHEMAELEAQDYLLQPHTSAGRIPTEKAFRYYISHALRDNPLDATCQKELGQTKRRLSRAPRHEQEKELAKTIAHRTHSAVVVGFSPNEFYATGFAELFALNDFVQEQMRLAMSRVFDELDEVLTQLFEEVDEEINVRAGRENPFGISSGSLTTQLPSGSLLSIVGPLRMDYNHHRALLNYVQQLLER